MTTKTCVVCGGVVKLYPSTVKRNRGKYCSRLCYDSLRMSTPDKFWTLVKKTETCWLWLGYVSPSRRYGQFRVSLTNKFILAHRYSYELVFGPIPKGMNLLHKCDNPICVNPEHLTPGTQKDNMLDSASKGRMAKKLTANDIPIIRSLKSAGISESEIAKTFRVSRRLIGAIIIGKIWTHVLDTTVLNTVEAGK